MDEVSWSTTVKKTQESNFQKLEPSSFHTVKSREKKEIGFQILNFSN